MLARAEERRKELETAHAAKAQAASVAGGNQGEEAGQVASEQRRVAELASEATAAALRESAAKAEEEATLLRRKTEEVEARAVEAEARAAVAEAKLLERQAEKRVERTSGKESGGKQSDRPVHPLAALMEGGLVDSKVAVGEVAVGSTSPRAATKPAIRLPGAHEAATTTIGLTIGSNAASGSEGDSGRSSGRSPKVSEEAQLLLLAQSSRTHALTPHFSHSSHSSHSFHPPPCR